MSKKTVKFKKLTANAKLPSYADAGANGLDVSSTVDVVLSPGASHLVPTGLSADLSEGTMLMVCPRSGLAAKNGVTVLNGPGIVDTSFRGEIKVILVNLGKSTVQIQAGDRIAQLVPVFAPQVEVQEVQEVTKTERGDGGFGSTGK